MNPSPIGADRSTGPARSGVIRRWSTNLLKFLAVILFLGFLGAAGDSSPCQAIGPPIIIRQTDGTYVFVCPKDQTAPLRCVLFVSAWKEGENVNLRAYDSVLGYSLAQVLHQRYYRKTISLPVSLTTRFYYSQDGQPNQEIRVASEDAAVPILAAWR